LMVVVITPVSEEVVIRVNSLKISSVEEESQRKRLCRYVSFLSNANPKSSRTRALGTISSLIRDNKPGVAAFKLENGYGALRDALSSDNVRFQSLSLVQYLLQENSSDCNVITELGFRRTMMHLVSGESPDVRAVVSSVASTDNEKLKQILKDRVNGISAMSKYELGAVIKESQLIDLLWSVCYNEASSLREKGLLDLPGEDASHQMPSLLALAADTKSYLVLDLHLAITGRTVSFPFYLVHHTNVIMVVFSIRLWRGKCSTVLDSVGIVYNLWFCYNFCLLMICFYENLWGCAPMYERNQCVK
ncbi:hypothetical protein MKW94_007155, partial [Papaver nudicaule]|nr:hypothetical protein [Papaver nudicaule]